MPPQFASYLRAATLTAGLFLGLSAPSTSWGQSDDPLAGDRGPGGTQEAEQRLTPRISPGGGLYPGTPPIIGVNNVVCPARCYTGWYPFGCRGYRGAGYYGCLRRYWGYGFYGPNYIAGPVPPGPTFGLVNGNMYSPAARRPGLVCTGGCRAGPSAQGYNWRTQAGLNLVGMPTNDAAATPPAATPPAAANPPKTSPSQPAPEKLPPPTPNAARLQIIVPANAEVVFDGGPTTQRGTIREFVSPPLSPDKHFRYTIRVRYTGADGQTVDDIRAVRVRANEEFRIDFTQPAPAEQQTGVPVARP